MQSPSFFSPMPTPALSRLAGLLIWACVALVGAFAVDEPAAIDTASAELLGLDAPEGVCWRPTELRGVGAVPTACAAGQERSGGLCYPACAAGYSGVGPVCWSTCPAGYTDDGAVCRRNAMIVRASTSACPRYDVCGLTLARGCSTCPRGYRNDGCTCRIDAQVIAKRSYGRGGGTVPRCAAGLVADAGLCSSACAAGFHGVGPVCWASCTGETPVACGAGCAESDSACALAITNQVLTPIETILEGISGNYLGLALGIIDTFNAYDLPLCEAPSAH